MGYPLAHPILLEAAPTGQCMQWQATLTTSNTAVTPLLNEVRLYYR
jgi:hypothetical protein